MDSNQNSKCRGDAETLGHVNKAIYVEFGAPTQEYDLVVCNAVQPGESPMF